MTYHKPTRISKKLLEASRDFWKVWRIVEEKVSIYRVWWPISTQIRSLEPENHLSALIGVRLFTAGVRHFITSVRPFRCGVCPLCLAEPDFGIFGLFSACLSPFWSRILLFDRLKIVLLWKEVDFQMNWMQGVPPHIISVCQNKFK